MKNSNEAPNSKIFDTEKSKVHFTRFDYHSRKAVINSPVYFTHFYVTRACPGFPGGAVWKAISKYVRDVSENKKSCSVRAGVRIPADRCRETRLVKVELKLKSNLKTITEREGYFFNNFLRNVPKDMFMFCASRCPVTCGPLSGYVPG